MQNLLRLMSLHSRLAKSQFNFKTGQEIHGFRVLESSPYPDSNVHLHHLQHQKTKAHFYHLEKDDPNNCFAPIIKTLIDNNKGTPHILEHLVCCGSQKYPIRDPFMNMIRRSLNTYMNAWTGQDFTCYPFSSSNYKDFNNLLRVYSDMVFKANLDYFDFRQEGWRYEVGDKGMEYKGVVFNEMKAAYQSPERQLWLQINKNLMPGTPYQFDTGGQPSQIVNLEYNELKDLFQKYYHPTNMGFYSYGNSDFTKILQFLDTDYLNGYKESNAIHSINSPSSPVHQSTIYSKEEDNQILLVYYLGKMDQIPSSELMSLGLLSYLLFQTNQSPMYEQLIEQGLGEAYTDSYGLSANKLVTFGFGLKGVQLGHSQFMSKIISILNKVKENGFSEVMLQQAITQTQISSIYPERNGGIKMLQKLLGVINHRGDVSRILNYKTQLAKSKAKFLDRQYISYLIDKYLIKNNHYTVVLQQSKDELAEQTITPPQRMSLQQNKVKEEQVQLLKRQEDPMNKSVLPTLELSDVNESPPKYKLTHNVVSNKHLYHVKTPSGLTHTKVLFRLGQNLPIDSLSVVDIWSYCVNKGISTQTKSYKELSKELALCSNGLSLSYNYQTLTKQPYAIFSVSCLDGTADKGMALVGEFISQMKFEDGDNLKTLLKGYQNWLRSDIVQNPIDYAVSIATGLILQIPGYTGRLTQALNSYAFAESYLKKEIDSTQLDQLKHIFASRKPEYIFHTANQSDANRLAQTLEQNLNTAEDIPKQFTRVRKAKHFKSLAFTNNYDVNYCVASYKGPKGLTKQAAELSIFLQLLQQKHLHKKIRQQGGAYGSGAKSQSEVIYFYSYADPQAEATFKVFVDTINQLLLEPQAITQEQIKESKLSIFGRIDVEPVQYQKGMLQILNRVSPLEQQQFRDHVRNAEVTSVLETGKKYLQGQPCNRIIFGKDVPEGFTQIPIDFQESKKTLDTLNQQLLN